MKDYYKLLGVDENADLKILKKKYRKLAQQYHPDRNAGDAAAEEKFKEISEAYSTLSDSEKRRQYDMMRQGGFSGNPFDMGGFGDIFSSFFGGNPFGGSAFKQRQQRSRAPKDPIINLKIPLSELTKGKLTKSFSVKKHIDCVSCNGAGGENVSRCSACNGLGKLYNNRQQGHVVFQNVSMCNTCRGAGKIIDNPCTICRGEGIILNEIFYDIHIDCSER